MKTLKNVFRWLTLHDFIIMHGTKDMKLVSHLSISTFTNHPIIGAIDQRVSLNNKKPSL